MKEKVVLPKTITYAAALIIVYLCGHLLITGSSLLIPFAIALLIWYFLNAIHLAIRQCPRIGPLLPYWLSYTLTFAVMGLLINLIFNIISKNVMNVMKESDRYQVKFQSIMSSVEHYIHFKSPVSLDNVSTDWSLQPILVALYGVFTTLTSSAVLIALYVIFLFVEQHFFYRKMQALLPKTRHRAIIENIFKHIVQDTQAYLGVKTFLSLIMALTSWMVMYLIGLDFAEFWALLIFFLNFIPNIGAIVATIFPALLALVQFKSWLPSLIMTTALIILHFIIGNLIEPRSLGKSLNLSPLVILMALAFWGSVWGVVGLFLAVPITVMMMIIFAHFESTRPTAILLSQDGCIQNIYAKL